MTSSPGSRPAEEGDGGLDALFDAMAHPHRRFLVSRLHADDGPLSVREVSRAIAAREDGGPRQRPTDVDAVVASFHHVHLPKLTDANVVVYDADDGTIARGRRTEEAGRHLAAV